MLHKLSLAVRAYPEEELLEKMAIISREDHIKALSRDEQKVLELAKARGIKVPEKTTWVFDPATGQPKSIKVPDIENLRVSQGKGPGKQVSTKVLTEKGFKNVRHRVPEPSPMPKNLKQQATERLIGQEYGDVSKSKLKQFRHRTVGPVKRFWAGRNLMGKWPNRLALLGALGASGLGIKAYLDANRPPPVVPDELPPEYYMDDAWKSAGYVEDIAATPRPVPQPKISPPSTKPPAALASGTRKPGAPGIPAASASGISGGPPSSGGSGDNKVASPLDRALKKQADDAIFPLLAGGAGGLGGYWLTDKFLSPYLKQREGAILAEIAKKQRAVDNLKKLRQYAPVGAAAAGAILLAALAASKARKSEAQRQQAYSVIQNPISSYDPSQSGFYPEEMINFGSPQGFY